MNLLWRLACLLGFHRRDRKRLWQVGSRHHSVCAGCGKQMVRGFSEWRLDEDAAGQS
ncbi:hypothetical protein ACFQ1E_10335 [Sphingomonas canadensis]|uniref:Uncharacterized protein n=1 Tax=Sphingomonas canadensis TaxID=1219257 RepID=A0ABW3H7S5_9SPHN|nr:hypothetical protein [Sphingomonas canadensis]MCW3836484.1 hypothetical protein [Sphingomonas canadensis]